MKYLGLVIIQNKDILQSLINSKVVEPSISVFGNIPSLNLNDNFSVSFNSSFYKSNIRNELLNGSKYIVINNLNLDKKHIDLIKIIKDENPDWFDANYEQMIKDMCLESFESESKIVDWIFEKGEIDFLPKAVVNEFIKNRFNNSLESIGIDKIFEVDEKLLAETEWFDDEIIGTKHGDFFVKRSINYSKRTQSITSDDLF